ncbi:MAG: acetyl-CoA carboxylase carboxyl transferase subunit beta [Chloroflexi bacterium]|nr:acetyl-CoA carboxylase carboxyl transferase subunit beta [Chloroflexota bacterium]|tara:strand:+ start:20104 stop:21852 length:1749 start_codon:yes stop_codon:yes gene_type:complete
MVRGFIDVVSAVFGRQGEFLDSNSMVQDVCLVCSLNLVDKELHQQYRICPQCRFHYSVTPRQRIELLTDPKTFKEKYKNISSLDPLGFSSKITYRSRLFNDQKRTGLTEAAIIGEAKIQGTQVVLSILDFSFLGGGMGSVVGEKIALACEYAIQKDLPLVSVITSGGIRLQEGALSLMQMAKAAAATNKLHKKGLPYLAILANPATGQAYASFANLADVILAEPGALIGLAPLRSLQQMEGEPLPLEAHNAESHLANGMIDGVVERVDLSNTIGTFVKLLSSPRIHSKVLKPRNRKESAKQRPEAWEAVQRTRHPNRPTTRDYIEKLFAQFIEIRGDRLTGDDPTVICGLAELTGKTIVLIGQQRINKRPDQQNYITPSGFHKIRRGLTIANKFSLPVITFIDTSGPSMTLEAEQKGIGPAIAHTSSAILDINVPTIALIIGEGGREGALALSMTDTVLMMENAIYTPVSPEQAANLMYRDSTRVSEAAHSLRLTARDAKEMNIIDKIIAEPEGGAHTDITKTSTTIQENLIREIALIQGSSMDKLISKRYKKFRNMGAYTDHFQSAVAREITLLRESNKKK